MFTGGETKAVVREMTYPTEGPSHFKPHPTFPLKKKQKQNSSHSIQQLSF